MKVNTKQTLLFLFCLLVVLGAADWFILSMVKKCPVGNIAKVNAVMHHSVDPSVSIWGSSTARINFEAELIEKELGVSCLNLGMNGTPFCQYSGLLEEYLDYSKNAKLLVIAIDINGLVKRNSLYDGFAWLHYSNNQHIYEAINSIDHDVSFKSRYVPFYYVTAYDRRFLMRCFKWVYGSYDGETELSRSGFHASYDSWEMNHHRRFDKPFLMLIDNEIVERVKKILDRMKDRKSKVAIVVTPCYIKAQNNALNMEEFNRSVASFESEGIKVFSYLKSPICLDTTNFTNNTHMNDRGANLFTKEFIKDIKNWSEW